MEAYLSRQVVPALKRAGFSAWKQGQQGFKVWSHRGGIDTRVAAYGIYNTVERNAMLDIYTAVLTDAGFACERHGHMIFVTGRNG